MELYVKFMFTLTVGLVGVGMVLKTLLETILHEWDMVREAGDAWNALFHARRPYASSVRAEDILMEIEAGKQGGVEDFQRRREAMREAETRGPVVTFY